MKGETIRPVRKLAEGETYIAGPDEYLVAEHNSLVDILRFLVEQAGDEQDIQWLLDYISQK